jgi:spore photoproduct lyase
MEIKKQKTKTLVTRDNGRSSDAISPNFIYGCLGGCMKSYCYVGRFNNNKLFLNENTSDILASISKWAEPQPMPKTPNQIDDKYYCIDIGCSTDVPLHGKHYQWQQVFDFFNTHPKLKSTFATKYPTKFRLDDYTLVPGKHRIRVSLMPQKYADVLEPNTDSIADRIAMIPKLQEKMEVHINFSPIIYHEEWLDEYRNLFEKLVAAGINVPCECIFLTYNNTSYQNASDDVNALCWKPEIQEAKDSQYAADNIRYKYQLKAKMIVEFTELYSEYFNPKNIRYIF